MSVSIISCPSCKTLVLSDTHQCPTCKHILNAETKSEPEQDLPAVVRASEDEVSCPDCGEQVRSGLVRCWRCGGFLREDIAESYQKMLDAPQEPILTDTSEPAPDGGELPDLPDAALSVSDSDDGDDFELADGLNMMTQDEMADLVAQQPAAPAPKTPEETYTLNRPPAADPPQAESPPPASPKAETPAPAASSEAPAEAPEVSERSAESGIKEPPSPSESEKAAPSESKPDAGIEKPKATGDPLLDIAMQEQYEAKVRQKDRKKKKGERGAMPGFLFVFCPNGHRIQVEERYRGRSGRCPRCKSYFHVPGIDWDAKRREEMEAAEQEKKESPFKVWKLDARLHQVDPTKLKLKPGSLEKDFQEVDLGYSDDKFLVVTNGKQGAGLFVGEKNKKKKEELRSEMQEHLRLENEILDLPAAGYREFGQADMEKMAVVQPAAYAHESMFAGVPVFGNGRIAVRLPVTEQDKDVKDILFVSFWLSEFREFAEHLSEMYGVKDLGQAEGVPLTESESTHKCHYSDRQIKAIEVSDFHTADPELELEIVGRRCAGCSLVVSEESRKKEKLGGAAGKGIAKAKCPKCKAKFGDATLYAIKVPEKEGEGLSESGGLNA